MSVFKKAPCGLDIGGTLAKLVYIGEEGSSEDEEKEPTQKQREPHDQFDDEWGLRDMKPSPAALDLPLQGGQVLKFECFHSATVDRLVRFMKVKGLLCRDRHTRWRGRRQTDVVCGDVLASPSTPLDEAHPIVSPEDGVRKKNDTIPKLISSPSSFSPTCPTPTLHVTGGGAFKYCQILRECLGVEVVREDEMRSVVRGLSFLLEQTDSVFTLDDAFLRHETPNDKHDVYPYLIINIGSGVSLLKVEGPNQFVRVTGTCIGGGTALGLARLLFGANSFEEVIRLSETGTECLDLTVLDLFGDTAGSSSLPENTLASSFGRVHTMPSSSINPETVRREDLARSLIHMVSYNLGYLAFLVGSVHNVKRLLFAGKYIHNSASIMQSIFEGVHFYTKHYQTKGERADENVSGSPPSCVSFRTCCSSSPVSSPLLNSSSPQDDVVAGGLPTPPVERRPFEVLFVRHDGYLGAMGCLLACDGLHHLQCRRRE